MEKPKLMKNMNLTFGLQFLNLKLFNVGKLFVIYLARIEVVAMKIHIKKKTESR